MARIFDISPVISPRLAVFPGDTPFERRELMHVDRGDHISLSAIASTVHLGSHADAPVHYGKGGGAIDLEAVLAHCRREMASYKVPRHLFLLAADAVPRTGTQKVDKPLLRREAARRAGGDDDLLRGSAG